MHENPELQREIIKSYLNFEKCQPDKIWEAYRQGKLEVESFSPYLSEYNLSTGDIKNVFREDPVDTDAMGWQIMRDLKELLPDSNTIILYDAYNTGMPANADIYGRPYSDDTGKEATSKQKLENPDAYPRTVLDESGVSRKLESVDRGRQVKIEGRFEDAGNFVQLEVEQPIIDKFEESIVTMMKEDGIIRPGDEENKNYTLLSESAKVKDAEVLVERLRSAGKIKESESGEITFVDEAKGTEILLRRSNGHWQCAALDASSYLDPKNLELTHLVILPKSFEKQQDEVWEILQSIGIQSTNYHNIFFDENLLKQGFRTEDVSQSIKEFIEKAA